MVNKRINPKKVTGTRLSSNKIKVQQLSNGQFVVTIPSLIASLLDLSKGTVVSFKISKKGTLEIKKNEDE